MGNCSDSLTLNLHSHEQSLRLEYLKSLLEDLCSIDGAPMNEINRIKGEVIKIEEEINQNIDQSDQIKNILEKINELKHKLIANLPADLKMQSEKISNIISSVLVTSTIDITSYNSLQKDDLYNILTKLKSYGTIVISGNAIQETDISSAENTFQQCRDKLEHLQGQNEHIKSLKSKVKDILLIDRVTNYGQSGRELLEINVELDNYDKLVYQGIDQSKILLQIRDRLDTIAIACTFGVRVYERNCISILNDSERDFYIEIKTVKRETYKKVVAGLTLSSAAVELESADPNYMIQGVLVKASCSAEFHIEANEYYISMWDGPKTLQLLDSKLVKKGELHTMFQPAGNF